MWTKKDNSVETAGSERTQAYDQLTHSATKDLDEHLPIPGKNLLCSERNSDSILSHASFSVSDNPELQNPEEPDKGIAATADTFITSHDIPNRLTYVSNVGISPHMQLMCDVELEDLEESIAKDREAASLAHDHDPEKPIYFNNLGIMLRARFDRLGKLKDLEECIQAHRNAISLVPDGHVDKPSYFHDLGDSLQTRFDHLGELRDLKEAIEADQKAVFHTPDDHPDKAMYSNNLGSSLQAQFVELGELTDVEESIDAHRKAVSLTPQGHPDRAVYLNNLSISLHARFERSEELKDLDESVLADKEAVSLTPDGHPDKPMYLNSLGRLLQARFDRSAELSDLKESIEAHRSAVSLTPDHDPDKPLYLNSLGNCLQARFKHLGELKDIQESIDVLKEADTLTPYGHHSKPLYLNNLGNSLLRQFQRTGELKDLDDSIDAKAEAISLTPDGDPYKSTYFDNLGNSFQARYDRLGELNDLEQAIKAKGKAISLISNSHPDKPMYWNNLGNSLHAQFLRLGELKDLNDSISAKMEAISLSPDYCLEKPRYFNNLGISLHERFGRLGVLKDLDESIKVKDQAISLTHDGHPDKSIYLNNLGISLYTRYHRLGELKDLDRSVEANKMAVSLAPDDHPDKPMYFSSLGSSLEARFLHLGKLKDLEESIEADQNALSSTPNDHPNRLIYFSNLGSSLHTQFKCMKELNDLERSIQAHQNALDLCPIDHPKRPMYFNNLASSLQSRFEALREQKDLEESMMAIEQAVSLTPDDHLDKPVYLNNLGTLLRERFMQSGDLMDFNRAIHSFKLSATQKSGSPYEKFRAARLWAELGETEPSHALSAYQVLIDMLPEVAWLGSSVKRRYEYIKMFIGDSVNAAVAAAIACQEHKKAVEWLEQGRSIVWGQILSLRTPLDNLWDEDPILAENLERLSRMLEQESMRGFPQGDHSLPLPLEQEAQHHRRLAEEREGLICEIRCKPGFENFFRPKKFDQLIGTVGNGPLVIVNLHKSHCDALILQAEQSLVHHVPLLDCSADAMSNLHLKLQSLIHQKCYDARKPYLSRESNGNAIFEEILCHLWLAVVSPVLKALNTYATYQQLPHITWCPTGVLTSLPLHAAGIYESGGPKLYNHAVSSYTPTISALMMSSKPPEQTFTGILAISQPQGLPMTTEEIKHVQEIFQKLSITWLDRENATVDAVLRHMRSHRWIHFACHASQNIHEPTSSGFHLHNGTLDIRTIMSQSFNGDLAFLSACETATGDESLPEESIHLAAGMMMAGYQAVIGTLWSINDYDGPLIAQEVYSHLYNNGHPDSSRAAHALHNAVASLRAQNGEQNFLSWVPFIHMGK